MFWNAENFKIFKIFIPVHVQNSSWPAQTLSNTDHGLFCPCPDQTMASQHPSGPTHVQVKSCPWHQITSHEQLNAAHV
jgi:hypothetical protein